MPAAPKELLLPPALDLDAAIALLRERLALETGRAARDERVLLDTFDGRLRAAGAQAELRGGELALREDGAPVRRADVDGRRGILAADVPAGVLRTRLQALAGPRALLPLARVSGRVQALSVVDREAKTIARLTIERADVVAGAQRVTLPARLTVRPVLGYDKAHERTVALLVDRLGFTEADESQFDAAVRASGGKPEGHKAKPSVALEAGMRADEAASRVLTALAEIARANLPGARADLDPEFLHHLRTSIRRARAVLRELKGVHAPDERAHLRDELKWAQAVTGPVRDLDVQLEDWEALVRPLAADRAAELAALRRVVERRRAQERARLRRQLQGKRFSAVLRTWEALAATPPAAPGDPDRPRADTPIGMIAGHRIRAVHRRMVRDGRAIDAASAPEALHELRKRGKELRYLLELFGDPFPSNVVKPLVATLKDLQSVLGTFQDRAVQAEFLHGLADELASEPGGPQALIALGPVLDVIEADQRAAREQFSAVFASFATPEQRKLVKGAFGR